MTIADDVQSGVADVLAPAWSIASGTKVPETEDIVLKNGAVRLDATYLYADMADSTGLAQSSDSKVAAKIIRAYLNAAVKIIKHRGGEIRSFDGDRVMAIFIGDAKNTASVRVALGISWAVEKVINPRISAKWPDLKWKMDHGVGIDSGEALLVRGGVRGTNDLVSIGRAPNVAAKLSEKRGVKSIFITESVYRYMNDTVKNSNSGESMWTDLGYTSYGGNQVRHYGSGWYWSPAGD